MLCVCDAPPHQCEHIRKIFTFIATVDGCTLPEYQMWIACHRTHNAWKSPHIASHRLRCAFLRLACSCSHIRCTKTHAHQHNTHCKWEKKNKQRTHLLFFATGGLPSIFSMVFCHWYLHVYLFVIVSIIYNDFVFWQTLVGLCPFIALCLFIDRCFFFYLVFLVSISCWYVTMCGTACSRIKYLPAHRS